jgi:hypothetical protein
MKIKPLTYRAACEFVERNHRHHHAPQGCKYAVGVYEDETLHGVVIVGRPVARRLDDGITAEITRCCTDGTRNACSMLYGAACRIAKEMGYERIITYTLKSEDGASVKAANFTDKGEAGGLHWTGKRNRGQDIPNEMKRLWERRL